MRGRAGRKTGSPRLNLIALIQLLRCRILFSVVDLFGVYFRRSSQEAVFSEQKNVE